MNIKQTKTIKSIFLSGAIVVSACFPLEASGVFRSLRGSGMFSGSQPVEFSQPELQSPEKEKDTREFFCSTAPAHSGLGAVKTFSVTTVKSLSQSDWQKVQKTNAYQLANGQSFIRPVMGRVSSLFGNRRHPVSNTRRFHPGIDIAARRGTPILSSLAGKVSFAGWRRGYGRTVIIDHGNGYQSYYAHCSRLKVQSGEVINRGQKIATVGSTGVSTGSHLHFEIRKNGRPVNPFSYIRD